MELSRLFKMSQEKWLEDITILFILQLATILD